MDNDEIVIVNENDERVGSMAKMLVHQSGTLHRAFSVVLFDGKGDMLIQKRSKSKYHSPGLWANACCSHQRAGETLEESARRRLREELGIDGVELKEAFILRYRCDLENSLIENEIDHVFHGTYAGEPLFFNREEVEQVRWVGLPALRESMAGSESYAYWFRLIAEKMQA